MALTDGEGMNTTMLVSPTGGYAGNNGGFGNDWGWIILLLLFAGGGYGGFGGFGGGFGNMMLGYDFPWLINGQQGINNNVSDGFRDAQLQDSVTSVRDGISALGTQICGGFGNVQTQLCDGFNGVTGAINGAQNALAQQLYTNQIADLERSFAAQTASTQGMSNIQSQLAQCCCDNRLATAQTQALVQSENCADRYEAAQNTASIINAITGGIQSVKDQLCQDKIDAKNDTIQQLRSELLYARGQASQDVQTAAIQAGQRALANEVEAYVAPRPIPSFTVQNPNCCTNSCGYGCGCGMN